MTHENAAAAVDVRAAAPGWRPGVDLFLISFFILFLELACIRWFPAHVMYLTFFTNLVLLGCFLGMSVGCMAAGRPQRYLTWTPAWLALAVGAAQWIDQLRGRLMPLLDVGHQASPQLVFFGTEYFAHDVAAFFIPIEVVGGFFFLVLALTFVGPGQELGRALDRLPNRVAAYTVNISGSIAGIVLFAGFSYLELPPVWWFLPAVVLLAYFLYPGGGHDNAASVSDSDVTGNGDVRTGPEGEVRRKLAAWNLSLAVLLAILAVVSFGASLFAVQNGQRFWSPYYRIDYEPNQLAITVNLISHQQMVPRTGPSPAYALPHLLTRDSGGAPFKNVLIIGAGSGNDVSRALQWGAEHVDAVEIDPVIQRIGLQDNPDEPYQDPRVTVHLGDGRNFLRSTDKQYDLIIYALVDSLVLHSSYSNIRLESYLFTSQAFDDVKRRLKPDGLFVMYNFFRQGWIVARLQQSLTKDFGAAPLVLTLPYLETIEPEKAFDGFTMFIAGAQRLDRLRDAFRKQPEYWVGFSANVPVTPDKTPSGFAEITDQERQKRRAKRSLAIGQEETAWIRFGPATVASSREPLAAATDDWPFLYLRSPMIPLRPTLSGMAVMAGLAVLLLYWFAPPAAARSRRLTFSPRMFFLGAGFMLVETKAVVHMALLFGSTWMVSSVVFLAVLIMILAANIFVLQVKPRLLWPYYAGLLLALTLNLLVPLDFFLGQNRALQVVGSCLLVFAPILFAGVIFATSFARTQAAGPALGANIAGAMLGGLAENTSMLLGFQHLLVVALLFYVLSMADGKLMSKPS